MGEAWGGEGGGYLPSTFNLFFDLGSSLPELKQGFGQGQHGQIPRGSNNRKLRLPDCPAPSSLLPWKASSS